MAINATGARSATAAGPGSQTKAALAGGFKSPYKTDYWLWQQLQQNNPVPRGSLPTEHPHSLTVLRAEFGKLLTKTVYAGCSGFSDYDDAFHYAATPVDFQTPEQALDVLRALEHRPDCAIVAGAIHPTANRAYMRRLKIARPKEQEGDATLYTVPRYAYLLDLDATEAPGGLDLLNLVASGNIARNTLPPPFRGALCIAIATSGYLIKPCVRFRLVFWLDRPLTPEELKRWLQREKAPVDFKPMHAAGVNYTAAPDFELPENNPLPGGRLVVLPGEPYVVTPDAEALKPPPPRPRPPAPAIALGSSVAALVACEILIERAEQGDRHNVIMQHCFHMSDYIDAGMVTEDEGLETIVGAGERVGKSRAEIERIFDWVRDKKHKEREEEQALEARVRMQMRSDEEDV